MAFPKCDKRKQHMQDPEYQIKRKYQHIPTRLTEKQFDEFILPHLSKGRRGPKCHIPLYKVFNYILHLMHTGMQWGNLPIAKGKEEGHLILVKMVQM